MFTEDTQPASQYVSDPNAVSIQRSDDPNSQSNLGTQSSGNSDSKDLVTARDLAREMEANQNPELRSNTQP